MTRFFPCLALAAALAPTTGCLAGALPPSRTEIGPFAGASPGQTTSGVRIATGAHTASASTRPVRVDVGAGYVYEREELDDDADVAYRGEGAPAPGVTRERHGAYLEASRALRVGRYDRQWLGVRGEAFLDGRRDQVLFGLAGRLSWEIFGRAVGGGAGSSACGFAVGGSYGTAGLGLYQELGVRATEEGGAAFTATAGLSLRLPLIAGAVFEPCALLR